MLTGRYRQLSVLVDHAKQEHQSLSARSSSLDFPNDWPRMGIYGVEELVHSGDQVLQAVVRQKFTKECAQVPLGSMPVTKLEDLFVEFNWDEGGARLWSVHDADGDYAIELESYFTAHGGGVGVLKRASDSSSDSLDSSSAKVPRVQLVGRDLLDAVGDLLKSDSALFDSQVAVGDLDEDKKASMDVPLIEQTPIAPQLRDWEKMEKSLQKDMVADESMFTPPPPEPPPPEPKA